jgi:glycerol-3-phosphate responsive antiterminator
VPADVAIPIEGSVPRPVLRRVLIADDGGVPIRLPRRLRAGILLREIDLASVVERAANGDDVMAIDLDSVRGMESDETAADFVMGTLHIRIVMTRRAHVAVHVAARGGIGLLHALAFDSTGLTRALEGSPPLAGVGTVVSPGAVLPHMRPSELEQLARPIVAYGLLTRTADVLDCLELADSVVLRQDVADALAATAHDFTQPVHNLLTTLVPEE